MSVRKPNKLGTYALKAYGPNARDIAGNMIGGTALELVQLENESREQRLLFKLVAILLDDYPELEALYAIPNANRRGEREGVSKKREGMKPGVWDLHLPVQGVDGSLGLWIEMKTEDGELSPDQQAWATVIATVSSARLEVCRSAVEAFDVVCEHLGIQLPDPADWRERVTDPDSLWDSIEPGEHREL